MIRYCLLGLMISLGFCGGCTTTESEEIPPKLEIGRQVAALKVSTDGVGQTRVSSSYEVHVCLWDERSVGAGEDISTYAQEVSWLRRSMKVDIPPNSVVDILSSPQVDLPPNEWRTMASIQRVGSTDAHTSFWVDGELLTVGSHPGLTLKAFVEPLENNRVQVKGAMVSAKMSPSGTRYHAFPFNVGMVIGSSVIVYEREVSSSAEK